MSRLDWVKKMFYKWVQPRQRTLEACRRSVQFLLALIRSLNIWSGQTEAIFHVYMKRSYLMVGYRLRDCKMEMISVQGNKCRY